MQMRGSFNHYIFAKRAVCYSVAGFLCACSHVDYISNRDLRTLYQADKNSLAYPNIPGSEPESGLLSSSITRDGNNRLRIRLPKDLGALKLSEEENPQELILLKRKKSYLYAEKMFHQSDDKSRNYYMSVGIDPRKRVGGVEFRLEF